jgi:uncharacterized protein YggE
MKKFAASLLMAGILAVTGFAAPANAAPDKNDTTVSSQGKKEVTTTNIGWWP